MPSVWTIPLFIAFALTSLVAIEAFLTPGDSSAEYLAEVAQENPALPDECLLVSQRYNLTQIDGMLGRQQLSIPSSKHLVILKLHLIPGGLRTDQALAFKALAAEVLEAGYDFFILQDRVTEIQLTAKQTLELLPRELHPFMIVHDFREPLVAYSSLLQGLEAKDESTYGPGPALAYLPVMQLMLQYERYEWMWEIEWDVRYIGHWGRFLNAVLHLAHGAEIERGSWDAWDKLIKHHQRHPQMHSLPHQSNGAPDLVFFGPAYYGDKWKETQVGTNLSEVWHASIMVWGASRKLFQTMHELSKRGQGSFVETFVMNTAAENGLKVVPVALPMIGDSYHCCQAEGEEIYQRFLMSTDTCTHNILLHPVKLCGNEWPREQGVTQHSVATKRRYGPKDKLC